MDTVHGWCLKCNKLGVGIILNTRDKQEFTYALRLKFKASKNEAEIASLLEAQ